MSKPVFLEENIVLNGQFEDKWSSIRRCGQILVDNGYVHRAYIDDMIVREEGATVYVGNSVAIPHGVANSENHILESGICFLQVPQGVDFGGETAYMLIGIAGKDGSHIRILGDIAQICVDIEKLKTAQTTRAVYEILSAVIEDAQGKQIISHRG